MKSLLAAACILAALPCAAHAQLRLSNPADANKDGVVTEDERHEYEGAQAAGARDAPPLYSPSAPKPGGQSVTLGAAPGSTTDGPTLEDRAVAPSDFEQAQDAQARKAQERD